MRIMNNRVRVIAAASFSFLLNACVGAPPDDEASSSVQSSSSTAVSSSSSFSSQSSSSEASSVPALIGDSVRGKDLYEGSVYSCMNCHGATGTAPIPAFPNIDPYKTSLTHQSTGAREWDLAAYITAFMPQPGKCDAQCGADIASYIETWASSGSSSSAGDAPQTCDADEATYGRRQLRLLGRTELINTLKDLVGYTLRPDDMGIPIDAVVEGFVNQTRSFVTSAHYDAYVTVAEAASQHAADNNFAGIVDCNQKSLSVCADAFVTDFASRAFRRPLSTQERARYRDVVMVAGQARPGITAALQAVLSSPNFLYRSELGQTVASLTVEINTVNQQRQQPTTGTQIVAELSGTALGINDGQPRRLNQNQSYGKNVGNIFSFSGKDLVVIRAKGIQVGGQWPTLELIINDKSYGSKSVNKNSFAEYSFEVDGLNSGSAFIKLKNTRGNSSQAKDRYIDFTQVEFGKPGVTGPSNTTQIALPADNLDADAYVLNQFELATFLAYTFTGSTPDPALLSAAKDWELDSTANIQKQVTRLLMLPKSKAHFGEFAAQWLGADNVLDVSKDMDLFSDFTPAVREAMAREVREIFQAVMFEGVQPVNNIFGDFSYINKTLADFYGVSGPSGNEFKRVNNLGARGGVLTSGAFMAGLAGLDEASPIKRAVTVRESLLCQKLPPMPTDIDSARDDAENALQKFIDEQGGSITNKQRFAFLTKDAPCSDCHREIINPLGFGMEDFDAVGRLRTSDANNLMVDFDGELIGTVKLTDGNVEPFAGGRALSNILQNSPRVPDCFVEKGFRSVMGIGHEYFDHIAQDAPELAEEEKTGYACALNIMNTAMQDNNMTAKAAFEALSVSDVVRYRKAY